MIDTGASGIVLSRRDAERVGLDPGSLTYAARAQTANGLVQIAPVRLDTVRLGDFTDTAVPAAVNSGALDGSLLGMSYLDRFARSSPFGASSDLSITIWNGRRHRVVPGGCHARSRRLQFSHHQPRAARARCRLRRTAEVAGDREASRRVAARQVPPAGGG
jgi:clan AA aspartic protease (TIGR02281 family)